MKEIKISIKDQEKILFDKFRSQNPIVVGDGIVEDGIVDEDAYLSSRFKILYVMKEVNGGKGWSLTDFLYNGGRWQTWDNIARWTEGIIVFYRICWRKYIII